MKDLPLSTKPVLGSIFADVGIVVGNFISIVTNINGITGNLASIVADVSIEV